MGDGFIVFLVPECLAGYMPVEDQENLRPLAMDSTCKEIHAIFKHCNHCFCFTHLAFRAEKALKSPVISTGMERIPFV
jgi:hypothetical protein